MPATVGATCPNCRKVFNVPAELVGKIIRCKDCQAMFEVMAPSAKPASPAAKANVPAKATAPAAKAASPTAAKPATPAAPAANAPIPFQEDPPAPKKNDLDDDDDSNPYGVTHDDSDNPRCPHCAKELDPPDTKICLHCGYDMLARRRHETKAVLEATGGEVFMHLLPGIICVIVVITLLALATICSLNMRDWMEGSFLETDEKDEATLKKKFIVGPMCFTIWIWIFTTSICFRCARFAVKRLIYDNKPAEKAIKKSS